MFGGRSTEVDHTNVPTAVFSEPEIGVIGLTEAQARERYHHVDIYKTTFRPMKTVFVGSEARMPMKLSSTARPTARSAVTSSGRMPAK